MGMFIEQALDNIDCAILFTDDEHRIQWMNKKARQWFTGLDIGKRRVCYRTLTFGHGFCTICPTGRTIDYGVPTHYEFSIPSGDKHRNLEVLAIPMGCKDERRTMVMEVVMDVTKGRVVRIKEEAMMAQIEKMAALGQLAAGVAHELNTPLGTLSIISDELGRILQSSGTRYIPKRLFKDYIQDMRGEIERCRSIIQDLLGFSRQGLYQFVRTDINQLVSKVVELIQKGEKKYNVLIEKRLDPELPAVMTDRDRFKQVVFNVIKNAIEAIDREDGLIEVSTRKEDCCVHVVIKDNGCGIPEENLKKVFEPFFTTKPVGCGTGLGLSVSYGIMRDLKGEIRLKSRVGEGTEVMLILPISEV